MQCRLWGVSTTALLAAVLVGCGSDKEPTVEESPDLGASTEKLVNAAAGGEVALDEAGVKLSIPAGALGADTMITAEVISKKQLVDAAQIAGNVLEFGPDGTTFEKPVTLELDAAEAKIPEGAKVTLAWLDTAANKWVELPGSKLSGGKVVGETTHFSVFAIRFEVASNGDVVQTGGQCSPSFNACGGNVEGTWKIVSGCANVDPNRNVGSECKGASLSLGMDVTGQIILNSGRITGTLNMEAQMTAIVPKSCAGGSCPAADDADDFVYVDKGATCEGSRTETDSNQIDEAYRIDGGRMYVGDSSDETQFCVTGNKLEVSMQIEENVVIRWTATRQ